MAHALVFGASGISGWAVVKEALSYPTSTSFAHVTGLTNRPLSIEDAKLPQDERLQLISGVDLTGSVEDVVHSLKTKAKHIEKTTHVFFMAYVDPGKGFDALREANIRTLKTAIEAVLKLTTKLESVVLQTGGKGYGVEFTDEIPLHAPLVETQPRVPEPFASKIFYYNQVDLLASLSKSAAWTFTEVRPDVIIGFIPTTNFMSCAQGLALYLSLYRVVHGKNAEVAFPGTEGGWTCKHSDTSQDILAKFEIHAALNSDKCGDGRIFNIADGHVVTWKDKWAGICSYFDLKGVGPKSSYEPLDEFAKKNAGVWDKVVEENGLKGGRLEAYGWGFLDFVMAKFDFDRQYDLNASQKSGFGEVVDTVDGYKIAFDRMRDAKITP